MKKHIIAAIGEILWDVLPTAETLGGAPTNFTYHVTALAARGIPISTIGNDLRGEKALAELQLHGVETAGISVAEGLVTGYVEVRVDRDGLATYNFPAEVAWDHLQVNDFAHVIRDKLDAVCFGSLAQRSEDSRRTILAFLDGLKKETVRVFDVNLRQNFYSRDIIEASLDRTDILKLNDEELPVLAELLGFREKESEKRLRMLVDGYRLDLAILSRGGGGSLLMTRTDSSDHPGIATRVVDTIGAGDAFTAAATIGYLERMALGEINEKANRLAAYVCTQQGAMPHIPENLKTSVAGR
jgi:fructokinase